MMVGCAIGGGEWLMGPAVTAQYGGIVMGLATLSIACQVAYNLGVMRYTLYCGEPIFVGFFRLWPGPLFWAIFYLFLDFFAVWPYLAASAAVPLHAAFLGRMPSEAEQPVTQMLAYGVFLVSFVPLIFGGKVYNSLEKMMVAKVVLVLGYLLFLGIFFVSPRTWIEVLSGFAFIGTSADGSWGFRFPSPPPGSSHLDWAALAAFAAIAGVGGLNNTQLSTYSRDKGWGMGSQVGAIPSMIGGVGIALSHTGKVFPVHQETLARWRGWIRFIVRDQWLIWGIGCMLGMAIPSLISLEFLRGQSVEGREVPAATARAIMERHDIPALWFLTLTCGFIVLAPAQVSTMDGLVRRWTDVLWTGSKTLRRLHGHQVKYVYYGLLGLYALWGLTVLTWLASEPLLMTKVAGTLINFGLGFSAFHTLAVNWLLLPRQLRPRWPLCLGLVACGVFFIGISALGLGKAIADLKSMGML